MWATCLYLISPLQLVVLISFIRVLSLSDISQGIATVLKLWLTKQSVLLFLQRKRSFWGP